MSKIFIGIVDYGFGNHASVVHSLMELGFRVRVSHYKADLDLADILVLPGVGAFPSAMKSLHELGLDNYLIEKTAIGKPLIGICLGMQLLTNASYENAITPGLSLIPGEIKPFISRKAHIGWNTLDFKNTQGSAWALSKNSTFYFNHSFYYEGPPEYQVATTHYSLDFCSIIQRDNVIGLQFHPEKSQYSGKLLLNRVISELANA